MRMACGALLRISHHLHAFRNVCQSAQWVAEGESYVQPSASQHHHESGDLVPFK